jgi:hypothetical protein
VIDLISFSRIYASIVVLYKFRHQVYISHVSPDEGPSGPKHAVSGIMKTFIYVTVTPLFLFVNYLFHALGFHRRVHKFHH